MLIAIDGMGGDHAPFAVVHGLSLFHRRCTSVRFLLYGDAQRLEKEVAKYQGLSEVCQVISSPEEVPAHMKPVHALRLKKSSMRMALEAVASGEASGVVSGGNTGAYMVLSKGCLKTISGIERPAIASQIPTKRGECVMLDLGGNLSLSARHFVDFALMGNAFAHHILRLDSPRVGLLNVGTEASKGDEERQNAFSILEKISHINFVGFIEGNDVVSGEVDVVVTDGFSGNIALKMGEGIIQMLMSVLKKNLLTSWRGRLGAWISEPYFREVKDFFDPRRYNGAVWLGLKGVAVKSHGGSDGLAFAHAVEMAYDMAVSDLNQKIEESLGRGRKESVSSYVFPETIKQEYRSENDLNIRGICQEVAQVNFESSAHWPSSGSQSEKTPNSFRPGGHL